MRSEPVSAATPPATSPATPPATFPAAPNPGRRTLRGVDRRTVLVSVAVAGGVLATAPLAGCAVDDRSGDAEAVRLQTAAARAETDAADARALAAGNSELGARLGLIAEQRKAHATAISDELSRYLQRPTSVSASASASSGPTPTATRESLIAQLARSAKDAGDAAVSASGYQAALLGSVAAATRAHAEVVLG